MKRKIITITDCSDVASTEIQLALLSGLNEYGIENTTQILPPASAENFSIANAAFCTRLLYDYCVNGDLILVIANATSSNPLRIFGETNDGVFFVGNDSGYFSWLFGDKGVKSVYKNALDRNIEKRPFGGKYVQVPTACKIMANVDFNALGSLMAVSDLNTYSVTEGMVVHIDNFGLVKIYSKKSLNYADGTQLEIYVNGVERGVATFTSSMKRCLDGAFVLYRGSSLEGLPELACVREKNTAKKLNIHLHDTVSWKVLN